MLHKFAPECAEGTLDTGIAPAIRPSRHPADHDIRGERWKNYAIADPVLVRSELPCCNRAREPRGMISRGYVIGEASL